MRAWAWLVLVVVLAVPTGVAQGNTFELPAGSYRSFVVQAQEGSRYEVALESDVPVDFVLVNDTDVAFANRTHDLSLLNQSHASAAGLFAVPGTWVFVVDNSAALAGGANGTQNATITLRLVISHLIPAPPAPDVESGSRNPWPVLMLTSPYWDLGLVGLGGMALWFLILAVAAGVKYREGWNKVGVLALGSGGLVLLWSLLPRAGPVADIALPLLFAAGLAWIATRSVTDGRQALAMAFLGGGFGALLGVAAAHVLRAAWSDPGMMRLGTGGFDDVVFILPVAAGSGAFLVALLAAIVEASEDDEPVTPAPAAGGLTATFTVNCVRCATPIQVDRSMRRYRVATDRVEFACPNCNTWMEWAEPKPAA